MNNRRLSLFFVCSFFLQIVMGFSNTASADNRVNTDLENLVYKSSYGHVRYYSNTESTLMTILDEHNEICRTVIGSDYIPLKNSELVNVIFNQSADIPDTNSPQFYIYFYDREKNVTWDIINHTDEKTGERNRVSYDFLKHLNGYQFAQIPDGYSIRIAPANGHRCQLIIWDGEPFGYPLTSYVTAFDKDGNRERLSHNASVSLQLPASARFVIAKPGYTFLNFFTSDTSGSYPVTDAERRFPSQVLDLTDSNTVSNAKNVILVKDYNYQSGAYSHVMPEADLSQFVVAVDASAYPAVYSAPDSIIKDKIEYCLNFNWEAKAGVTDNWGTEGRKGVVGYFQEGITYHGIPYRSAWTSASSIGWHITKQTFMNAANDPDSIFYHNPSGVKTGPYYSLVCSSFGTLVAGFPYPMTNFGMMRDPNVRVEMSEKPVIGTLMTNGTGHCYIPICVPSVQTETYRFTLAEQIGPLTAVRNVYNGIDDAWKGLGLKTSYPDNYVYACSVAVPGDIPYNITSYTLREGNARPYRGDQSVYTSAMEVLINVKDSSATRLYFQECDVEMVDGVVVSYKTNGKPHYGEISPGTTQVNIRSATNKDGNFTGVDLKNGAIYAVWTSVGDSQRTAPENVEFFEWYDLKDELISYSVKDGILYTEDAFWYAITSAYSDSFYINENAKGGLYSVGYRAPDNGADSGENISSDYSSCFERARLKSASSVKAFFRKGLFGAYVTGKEIME